MSVNEIQVPKWVQENFDVFERTLNGEKSQFLHQLRRRAIVKVHELGFPTPSNEDWKYTNVAPLGETSFQFTSGKSVANVSLKDIEPFLVDKETSRIIFVDGMLAREISDITALSEGVSVSTFSDSFKTKDLSDSAQALQQYFFRKSSSIEQTFVALNTAFLQDGVFVHVRKAVQAAKPLQILFVSSKSEKAAFLTPRVLVIAEKSSEVAITESHIGLGSGQYFSSAFCELSIAENAKVDFSKIGLEGQSAIHIGTTHVRQAQNSRCEMQLFTFGGKLVRNEVTVTLEGQNCQSLLNGLSVLNGEQHVDNHTVLDHAKPHCESHERIKGIYTDKSKGVFNGTIIVRPDAQKTNAIQSNQSLLLSKDATIDSKPQLKIWAGDVKCTHGATVGQLDEDAMFYLRSRGIDKLTARNILVQAFASETISDLNKGLKEYLENLITQKLSGFSSY